MRQVRTRFAPSPTGNLHIGGLRTALYAYALAKKNKGSFILRIEDTDKKREVKGSTAKIKELLQLFGLNWDEYYIQSDRLDYYRTAAEKLITDGQAFYCQCQAKNAKAGYSEVLRDPCRDKKYTSGAIKLKVPEQQSVGFNDFVIGKTITWNTSDIADTILLKSDGYPTYHLAVVVDDDQMHISHVLRGHDWLPSTPIHLLVYQFLQLKPPLIGHLTDILDPEGGKLSKRRGSTTCEGLLSQGYLPEAILNFIMLLGWAPKDNRENFTLEEFVQAFAVSGLQKSNPVFNREKLDWFNGEYIRKMDIQNLTLRISNFFNGKYPADKIGEILPLVRDRIKTLQEFETMAGFFFEPKPVDRTLLGKNYQVHLQAALEALKSGKALDEVPLKQQFKVGDFFMDLRIAITGSRYTPPINESIGILGKTETIARLKSLL